MKIVNLGDLAKEHWISPKGKFESYDQEISVALGRVPLSLDLQKRHPFDVEVCTIPPNKTACPYHSHSAQWEYYQVLSGAGSVRHSDGMSPIKAGDAFIFQPEQPHQLINDGHVDLVVLIVADNPVGESGYYPDSKKWIVRSPERRLLRSDSLDYFDGEE